MGVSCDLGGGRHGHLGLVLSPEEYALVSDTPYVAPEHPGNFELARNTAHEVAITQREAYYENLRVFRESVEVHKALVKQIVAAIDDEFLEELKDDETNDISKSIPEILSYLFENFAEVSSADVKREEEKIKNYYWDINTPPMVFYTLIEDLQKLATAAKLPRTEQMMVDYGLGIIQRTNDFEAGLVEWFRAADRDKTWTNFKRYFSRVHRDLKKARGDTMKNTSFHQANNMANDITESISDLRSELRQSISALGNPPLNNHPFHASPHTHQHSFNASPVSTLAPSANSATTDDLLKLVIQLQNQILSDKQSTTEPSNPQRRSFVRNKTDKYCWSHGACGHDGKDCRNKKPGHRDDATFGNRLGGSNFYCKQAEENNKQSL